MKVYTFKAFGAEFPITLGAVSALGVVVVLGTAGFIYQKLYNDPERALLSLKEVNARMAAEVEEFGQHVMEEPTKHELFEDEDGALMLRVYADHCVLIQRRLRNGGVLTKLVPDLARANRQAHFQIAPPTTDWFVVHAAQPCNRGCLNPHPGQFRWWYGARRGEWVEVWREWPEGCLHFQLFHPASGSWQSNPDGSAHVTWRCCVH